ncbi:hypothetical protein UMC2_30901 [[Clostridium] sordellii]|uniref:hypothetical protein n=1 Tax=Paraclostridium sordellii TaxID=1505 RepID=UPI0005429173|nr:hypothetical protein [Paeniclostridium sordellii]CEK36220.1 hypothetical protein UMC2_30901 [[Clostridium] sordellii] [Paeniclostridium sordellii]
MKLYDSFRIYRRNVYNYKNLIFTCFIIFILNILTQCFFSSRNNEIKISEIYLVYRCMSKESIWIYIIFCTTITLRILSFTEQYLCVLRLHKKDLIWKLAIQHILTTNFIISLNLVLFSYIFGLICAKEIYMSLDKAVTLLLPLTLLFTIGLSIFATLAFIAQIITRNKNITYLIFLAIIIKDFYSEGYSLLNDMSFNVNYMKNIALVYLSILKLGGGIILLFELGRFFYKREDIYNTKNKLMDGN